MSYYILYFSNFPQNDGLLQIRKRDVSEYLGNLSDKTSTVNNVKSVVKLFLSDVFCSLFVWDKATLDKFPWQEDVEVIPGELAEFLIEERHRQAKLFEDCNGRKGFNHQIWMRALRKIFTTAAMKGASSVCYYIFSFHFLPGFVLFYHICKRFVTSQPQI